MADEKPYEFREFPKWKFHPTDRPEGVIVDGKEAEDALGEGWHNTPATFPEAKKKGK